MFTKIRRLNNNIYGSRPNLLFNDIIEELEIKFEKNKKVQKSSFAMLKFL